MEPAPWERHGRVRERATGPAAGDLRPRSTPAERLLVLLLVLRLSPDWSLRWVPPSALLWVLLGHLSAAVQPQGLAWGLQWAEPAAEACGRWSGPPFEAGR
jgi:hypothetical protein